MLLFIIGFPVLGNAQEPNLQELKDRTVKKMEKINPEIFIEENLWRVNVSPNTYKKTPTVEQWEWTFENVPNEEGEFLIYKFLFENKIDSIPECTPNKSLGSSINITLTPEVIKEYKTLIRNTLKTEHSDISSITNITIIKLYPEPFDRGIINIFTATITYTNGESINIKGSFLKNNSDDEISWIFKNKII